MVCFHVFAKPHSRQIHESYTTSALSLPSSLFNSQSPVRPSGVQLCASRMVWRDEGSLVAQPLLDVLPHQSAVTNHLSRVTNYVFPSSAKNRYFPYGPKCPTSRLPSTSCARLIKRRAMNRGSGLRIGRILGIPIYLHSTWVFIFAAITYIIASQFKQQHPLWTDTQHWTVGVLTSLLFFPSVLFHDLGHSVLAQHSGIHYRDRWTAGQRLPRRKFFWLNASLPLQPDGRSTGHLALPHQCCACRFQSLAGISSGRRKDFPRHRLGSDQEF